MKFNFSSFSKSYDIVKKINLGRLRMSLNVVKINKNEIEISAAAMPPSYLFNSKSKKCEEIMIEGLPLGGLKDEKFTMLKKSFQKGDVLVMLSDGFLQKIGKDQGFDQKSKILFPFLEYLIPIFLYPHY